jgi:hypothetical protein
MASRLTESCSPVRRFLRSAKGTVACRQSAQKLAKPWSGVPGHTEWLLFLIALVAIQASAQILLKPSQPGEPINLMPSDLTILEAGQERKDLPCTVTQRKPELGFDLRFHAGYDVTVPMNELVGESQLLTVVFRVVPKDTDGRSANFVQHFTVPAIADDAKGDALLQGVIDLGEGSYHVDWLMRDRAERVCATTWDVDVSLSSKDKPIPLFLSKNRIEQASNEPFYNDPSTDVPRSKEDKLNIKLLVNFAPQNSDSAALQRSDTDALVSILKTIERDPRVIHVSLVAFNINEGKVLYRQDSADQIDFPALGKALRQIKLGTINIQRLNEKHSETEFLETLISSEMKPTGDADAVIFAGPKAMLDATVPQEDLRRIGGVECPVFYMNYNLDPQATPWKDSISHAIRTFNGTEYTISRPRDLWYSTVEMFGRIVRFKRNRSLAALAIGGSR